MKWSFFPCFPTGTVSLGGEPEMTPPSYVKCSNRVNTSFGIFSSDHGLFWAPADLRARGILFAQAGVGLLECDPVCIAFTDWRCLNATRERVPSKGAPMPNECCRCSCALSSAHWAEGPVETPSWVLYRAAGWEGCATMAVKTSPSPG